MAREGEIKMCQRDPSVAVASQNLLWTGERERVGGEGRCDIGGGGQRGKKINR